jgi:hypothetical protein
MGHAIVQDSDVVDDDIPRWYDDNCSENFDVVH